ncbi:hypothetical protein N7468_004565 [Penicillium chermesinum]|uniref:ferric-chelate reductase (NADPH) n=1 Tax=Penicillium chermesinum TaxID=63820 RepID=A0A9W9TSP6_9EURO|nr:uncharacterized protein N7468_004565 [Penicillium chermesinum]KAJ5239946.1 hypothetical protein N7468_004565 [Penicillium chermesinum]
MDIEKRSAITGSISDQLGKWSLVAFGCTAAFYLIWQMMFRFNRHLRLISSFGDTRQRYFISAHGTFAWFKEHIIYAPLFRNRHNREFQLSSAINMGNLPSRVHGALTFGLIGMNVALCVVKLPYSLGSEAVVGAVISRTGTLATINLIPLMIMVGRNNPLISLLHVPFDTWNLLHRWLGRVVVLEGVAHTLAWAVSKAQTMGWSVVNEAVMGESFLWHGLMGTVALGALFVHSPSPLRHAFYETFLSLHIIFAAVCMGGLWVHLDGMPSQNYLLAAIILWIVERFIRLVTIIYRNIGSNCTTATVEALYGDAMRIHLRLARPWTVRPGQHLYLYIPAIGWWTSHPFSVAWSEQTVLNEKGLPVSSGDSFDYAKQETISLLVRRCTGLTDKLFLKALATTGLKLRAFAEGPYGSIHSMDSYGTVMLFAGGVGVTHHIPFVRHLVAGHAEGTVAARRVTLVWIIQSPEHLEWIRPWMTQILAMDRRREVLQIKLFITRPRSAKEIQSPSSTVQMFPGRPNIDTLVGMEVENQVGAMGVLVCGNGSLSDDVRQVCRRRQSGSNLDYIEESFSW